MTVDNGRTRDPTNGQFAFDNNFDRMCKCGHPLGAHLSGGFDCGVTPGDYPESKDCKCLKFRPKRSK